MALIKIPAYNYSVYCGDASLSTALTKVPNKKTGNISIRDEVATKYLPALNIDVQEDFHRVTFGLNLYNPSDLVTKMSKGIALTGAASGAIGNALYSVLLLTNQALSATENYSFYFPSIRTQRSMEVTTGKTVAATIPINFIFENRSPHVVGIVKANNIDMKAYLAARSPY